MTGDDAKALRRTAGMSQAEFGVAIGLSRETIGRIERGAEQIDRRTELAMRYVAEVGPLKLRSLLQIHGDVWNVLDEAAVRGRTQVDATRELKTAAADWTQAGGSSTGANLLLTAQGVVGMLNCTEDWDPSKQRFFADLRQLKLAWQAVRNELQA